MILFAAFMHCSQPDPLLNHFILLSLFAKPFAAFFKHAVCACDRGDFTVSLLQQVMLHLLGDSDGTLCAGMNKRDTKRWLNDEFWMHM